MWFALGTTCQQLISDLDRSECVQTVKCFMWMRGRCQGECKLCMLVAYFYSSGVTLLGVLWCTRAGMVRVQLQLQLQGCNMDDRACVSGTSASLKLC